MKKTTVTIGQYINKLLLETERRKVNPGIPYKKVLEKVKKKFPEAKTTLPNIYWYASVLRQEGVELPKRPRK